MTSSDLPAIQAWLLDSRHAPDSGMTLMQGLVDLLRARGLPLWRCSFSLMTKHPELVWHTVQWREATGVTFIDRQRRTLDVPFFTRSPMPLIQQGSPPIRVRLTGDDLRFPVCEDLKAIGGTDYMVQGLPHASGEIGYVSWATRAPGGFTDEALACLVALTPHLSQRIELESAYHATQALMEVYLGRNAGQRVVRGAFRRGTGDLMDAAIWFCDLRDFTALSDRLPPQEVVKTLDEYFDRVAGAVMQRGGEVLKFIGDAILAIFPVDGDASSGCTSALRAAEDALQALTKLNVEREARGDSRLAIGVALHVGPLMYGNIGAKDRLDFTVISAAVNETCRLEALCKPLRTPLTMSEAFVKAAQPEAIVDLGRHALKGVLTPLQVFTLRQYAPPPA